MILVDSSVWIDFFCGTSTPASDTLDDLLATEPLIIGDLVLTEVLQGFDTMLDFNRAKKMLMSLEVVNLGGQDVAVKAAMNFRTLRAMGITVRKTIDTIIATCCIENGFALLHSDRDFDPFVRHLGLLSVIGND